MAPVAVLVGGPYDTAWVPELAQIVAILDVESHCLDDIEHLGIRHRLDVRVAHRIENFAANGHHAIDGSLCRTHSAHQVRHGRLALGDPEHALGLARTCLGRIVESLDMDAAAHAHRA